MEYLEDMEKQEENYAYQADDPIGNKERLTWFFRLSYATHVMQHILEISEAACYGCSHQSANLRDHKCRADLQDKVDNFFNRAVIKTNVKDVVKTWRNDYCTMGNYPIWIVDELFDEEWIQDQFENPQAASILMRFLTQEEHVNDENELEPSPGTLAIKNMMNSDDEEAMMEVGAMYDMKSEDDQDMIELAKELEGQVFEVTPAFPLGEWIFEI